MALACYAAFAVPMGKRTLAGHVQAIFTTPTAKDAAGQIAASVRRLLHEPPREAKQARGAEERRAGR